jgi:hypothetical protein
MKDKFPIIMEGKTVWYINEYENNQRVVRPCTVVCYGFLKDTLIYCVKDVDTGILELTEYCDIAISVDDAIKELEDGTMNRQTGNDEEDEEGNSLVIRPSEVWLIN